MKRRAIRKKIWQEAMNSSRTKRKKPTIPDEPKVAFEVEDDFIAARIARFMINELGMQDTISWWGPEVLAKEADLTEKLQDRIERAANAMSSLYRLLKKRKQNHVSKDAKR